MNLENKILMKERYPNGNLGVSDMAGNVPVMLAKVMESVKETTGIDMMEIVKASTYDAKVTKNVTIDGAIPTKDETSETTVVEESEA